MEIDHVKTCSKCGRIGKSPIDFPSAGSVCRKCVATRTKEYESTHHDQHRKRLDSRIIAVRRLKEGKPCVDCGRIFPYYVMDFDHRDSTMKEFQISNAVKSGIAWKRVLEEIEKCDLLCCCCHRLRTRKRNSAKPKHSNKLWRSSNLRYVSAIKSSTPCTDCGNILDSCQMDFDHVRGEKVSGIAQLMDVSRFILDREISKCELVCANCHRIRTWSIRSVPKIECDTIPHRTGIPTPKWWHYLVGELPDAEIARQAKIDKSTVGDYRKHKGIPVVPSRYTRKEAF